jgi:hypothetical protein
MEPLTKTPSPVSLVPGPRKAVVKAITSKANVMVPAPVILKCAHPVKLLMIVGQALTSHQRRVQALVLRILKLLVWNALGLAVQTGNGVLARLATVLLSKTLKHVECAWAAAMESTCLGPHVPDRSKRTHRDPA